MAWMRHLMAAGAAGLAMAGAARAEPAKQVVTGPVATYWMSAQTLSGFGAGMGQPGGKRPGMGAMMGMMMGAGSNPQHALTLQLGSSRKPSGPPQAEHLPPAGLKAGASLPLVTPVQQPTQRTEEEPSMPREYQKPKGRMLIFWGCGEHAKPGQPVVIDFAQMADGRMPPGLEALGRGLGVTPMKPPSPARNTTYGEWPNDKTRTQVPGDGSLVGDHVIRGDYSPEIHVSLAPDQDFLAALDLVTNKLNASGSGQLGWTLVPRAQAYLATGMGGGQDDTVVLWTSSEVQASAFALPDYLSNADLSRLTASHALMGPQTAACVIPQEAVKAAPQMMVQLAAYGPEANFAWPARPADPKIAWNIDWTVKVRYRSQTGALLGMDMPGARPGMGPGGEANDGEGQGGPNPAQPQKKPRPGLPIPGGVGGAILKGLGGKIPGI